MKAIRLAVAAVAVLVCLTLSITAMLLTWSGWVRMVGL